MGRWCWYTLSKPVSTRRGCLQISTCWSMPVSLPAESAGSSSHRGSRIRPDRSVFARSRPPLPPRSGEHRCAGPRRAGAQSRRNHYSTRSHRTGAWRNAGTQPNGVVANYRWVSPGSAATAFTAWRSGSQAAAVAVDDLPHDQRSDLAFLLGLVRQPTAMRDQLTSKDRQRLLARSEMLDPRHRAWSQLPTSQADRGRATLKLLLD